MHFGMNGPFAGSFDPKVHFESIEPWLPFKLKLSWSSDQSEGQDNLIN